MANQLGLSEQPCSSRAEQERLRQVPPPPAPPPHSVTPRVSCPARGVVVAVVVVVAAAWDVRSAMPAMFASPSPTAPRAALRHLDVICGCSGSCGGNGLATHPAPLRPRLGTACSPLPYPRSPRVVQGGQGRIQSSCLHGNVSKDNATATEYELRSQQIFPGPLQRVRLLWNFSRKELRSWTGSRGPPRCDAVLQPPPDAGMLLQYSCSSPAWRRDMNYGTR